MTELMLAAPAKLNLFLHVLGRRADGYHEIESLVAFTKLADELHIREAAALSLTVGGEFAAEAGNTEDNLVMKAARALLQRTEVTRGAQITLTKNIPVGAGLGGGSSDAAAVLAGLNTFWQLGLNPHDLRDIAITLGADVAMCLEPRPAIVRGIGELISPLTTSLPTMGLLLAYPCTALLTKDVYAAFTSEGVAKPWNEEGDFWEQMKETKNQLQRAAIAVNPLVAEVLLALETASPAPDVVRMTGSGACCFALYRLAEGARLAAVALRRDYPDWWIYSETLG